MSSPINRDYARKPELIGDISYLEWMKKPPFRALQWIREQKESEFKKPYREDDHVPMEHFVPWPPPWMPPFPPFPPFPEPVPEDPGPWFPGGPPEEEPWEGVCPGYVMCDPGNPTTIAQGESVVVNVLSCPPPARLYVEIHEDNYFNLVGITHIGGTDIWAIKIEAEADACGTCTIIATDPGGGRRGGPWSAICYLRCTTGEWQSCCSSGYWNCSPKTNYEFISGPYKMTGFTCPDAHTPCRSCDCDGYKEYCVDTGSVGYFQVEKWSCAA